MKVIMEESRGMLSHVIHDQEPEGRCDTHKSELPLGPSFTSANLLNKQGMTVLFHAKAL